MNDKQRVAESAVGLVNDGMIVGLGTGSTADYFIQALARRHKEENLNVTAVSSSVVSFIKAQTLGLPLMSIEQVGEIDLYVDGADEVSPDLTLLKGQGADLVREKLLAKASSDFIVLVDESKLVERIGQLFPIPIEVMPFAWQLVRNQLQKMGAKGELRRIQGKDGLVISSYGSLILDMCFPSTMESDEVDRLLNAMPGIVEHGIFKQLASKVLIGRDGRVDERLA